MLSYWQDYPEIQTKLERVQNVMVERLKINNDDIRAALEKFSKNGGKMVRPALFFLFASLSNLTEDDEKLSNLTKIAASLEMLHSATLIHDDIIDDSPLRRNLPSIQSQFGKDIAVYAGDFIYTVYFELLVETMSGTDFLARNAKSMKKILSGELTQMQTTFDTENTVKKYLKAINGKTAELLSLSCLEGAYFSGMDKKTQAQAAKIGRAIGLAFQIYDDILNFTIGLEEENKPILTDFRQGIFTLPVLIAKQNQPEQIIPYMNRAADLTKAECVKLAELVDDANGISESLLFASNLTNIALKAIEKLPDCEARQILLEATEKLLERNY